MFKPTSALLQNLIFSLKTFKLLGLFLLFGCTNDYDGSSRAAQQLLRGKTKSGIKSGAMNITSTTRLSNARVSSSTTTYNKMDKTDQPWNSAKPSMSPIAGVDEYDSCSLYGKILPVEERIAAKANIRDVSLGDTNIKVTSKSRK